MKSKKAIMLMLLMIFTQAINASESILSNKRDRFGNDKSNNSQPTITYSIKNFEAKYINKGIEQPSKKIYSLKDIDSSQWQPAYIPTKSDIDFDSKWDNTYIFAVSDSSDDEIHKVKAKVGLIKTIKNQRPVNIHTSKTKTGVKKTLEFKIPPKITAKESEIPLAIIHDYNTSTTAYCNSNKEVHT